MLESFTPSSIHSNSVFFKHVLPSPNERISEIDRNVKSLIKNIDRFNNLSCCQLCSVKSFQEIVDGGKLVDQKIQAIKKRILSPKQKELVARLVQQFTQQSVSTRQLVDRKLDALPLACFRGFVRRSFFTQKHSWTQILPCATIFGVGAAVSLPFGLGMLAGLANYTFSAASIFFYLKYFPSSSSAAGSEGNKGRKHSWTQILPYLVAAGVGFATADPRFYAGISNGLLYSSFALAALSSCLKYLPPSPSFTDSNLFMNAFFKPLNEEILYRGVLQKFVCNVTGSPLAGIVVSAGLFGAEHLRNGHESVVFQSIQAALSGVVYGTMNYYLGLAAPFGAHAMKNFLVCK